MVGSTSAKTVTIQKRGTSFHDDSFFKDSWDEWDKAMHDVVSRWDTQTQALSSPPGASSQPLVPAAGNETRSVYRKIRSSNVTSDESQAVSCVEEEDRYKMIIDVKDFKPEDINVKTVDDTVVVEGKIEKKEGNSISTQTFVRKFLLPPGINLNAIGSALSRDGVLTVIAPKLATKSITSQERSIPVNRSETLTSRISSGNLPAAGAPTSRSSPSRQPSTNGITYLHKNPPTKNYNLSDLPAAGKPTDPYAPRSFAIFETSPSRSSAVSVATPQKHVSETITINVPDRRGSTTTTVQPCMDISKTSDKWSSSFNDMVERSQKEMDEMMRRHTLNTSIEPPPPTPKFTSASNTSMVVPSSGVSTTRDLVKDGAKTTEREEHQWKDQLAPGIARSNRAVNETTTIKGDNGQVVGTRQKNQQHSHAEGSNVQVLPDGSKKQTFTKNYETRHVYSANSNGAKAV